MDPTLLILSIGSVILTIIAGLRCIKSCSSICCTVKMQPEPNPIDVNNPTTMVPIVQKTQLLSAIQQRFTPRTAKTVAQPNAILVQSPQQSPCASDSIVMSV